MTEKTVLEWFDQQKQQKESEQTPKRDIPQNLWIKCKDCNSVSYIKDIAIHHNTCPHCNYYFRLTANQRIDMLVDTNSFVEIDSTMKPTDFLKFIDKLAYSERISKAELKSNLNEAVMSGFAKIDGNSIVICAMDFNYMGGSMGSVVGEKITRAIEYAIKKRLPLVIISASGGARMQEGIMSLMQMAKISAALAKLKSKNLLYLSICTDPTAGGVTASFAMLGDIIIAEPNALICFAGPRVIKQTILQDLPENFQTSEYLIEHGMIDLIVERKELKTTLSKLVSLTKTSVSKKTDGDNRGLNFLAEFKKTVIDNSKIVLDVITDTSMNKIVEMDSNKLQEEAFLNMEAIDVVKVARHPKRPQTMDYIANLFDDYIELHGDRKFSDDKAIIGGFASFNGQNVMVIGHQKGRNTKQNIERNFGMPQPEGYRKAIRLMKLAEQLDIPILVFIDTPGAYPGIESEERGVAEAIAYSMREMSQLSVPIIGLVIGEGGSGGALGIAIVNKLAMLQYAYYSVISPEGCASILWSDASEASVAAENLGLTSSKLLELEVIEEIIPEPIGGAHYNHQEVYRNVNDYLTAELNRYQHYSSELLVEERYHRYRNFGFYSES